MWHWLGTSLRFLPHDLKLQSTYNPQVDGLHAYDWPLDYDELEPWYGLAEQTIGVSGAATGQDYLGLTRSSPFPMPLIPLSYLDNQFIAATKGMQFEDNGQKYPMLVSSTPQGRNSIPGFGNRPQCKGSTSCIPICPIQAKYDPTQHIELAKQTGDVEFRSQAVAYQVVVDASDTSTTPRISEIKYKTYTDSGPGPEGSVSGKIFVLCAHAIENAKLLLMSPWKTNTTVANTSDQVGRNLADHPVSLVYALVDDPVYPYRGPLATSGIESLRDGAFRSQRGCFRMEIGNDGWSWPTYGPYNTPADFMSRFGKSPQQLIDAGQVPLYGQALAEQVKENLTRQSRIGCLAEGLPNPDYRVTLSTELDDLGIPRPQLAYGIDEYAKRSLNASVEACLQVYKALIKNPRIQYNWVDNTGTHVDTARSDEPDPDQPYNGYNLFVREGWAGAGHIMGTHRMGDDPGTSVTDANCICHDHPNLYLMGSGLWPSYTAANPTLTIAALALRATKNIDTQLKAMK